MRRAVAPALWALATYRATSFLLVAAVAAALGATYPVFSLAAARFGTQLGFVSVPASGAPIEWTSLALTAGETQQDALLLLYRLLLAAAALVLVIASITILTLGASRAAARSGEINVRRAVGASRRTISAAALIEAFTLAAAGIVLGFGIGAGFRALAEQHWPGTVARASTLLPLSAVALAVLALGAGAALPVLFTRRRRLVNSEARPLELVVLSLQLGASLIVLTGTALLARPTSRANEISGSLQGFEVLSIASDSGDPAERAQAYAALLNQLKGDPLVSAAALTSPGTLVGLGTSDVVTTDCGYCAEGGLFVPWRRRLATYHFVSADTFRAIGARLEEGRTFSEQDLAGGRPVAVIGHRLAHEHFQNGEALGRDLFLGTRIATPYRVIGVVSEPEKAGFGSARLPEYTVYLSVLQQPPERVELLIKPTRSTGAAFNVEQAARTALGPGVRISMMSAGERLAAEAAPLSWFRRWLAIQGWAALAIAVLAGFVIMRLWVHSILPELGVRRAIGARRRHLIGFVLWRSVMVGLGGIGVGLWFGPSIWSILDQIMPGLSTWDPNAVARVGAILVAATLAGALAPALAAAHEPPAALLESDA